MLIYGTSAATQCEFGAPCFALDAPPLGPTNGGVAHLTHFNGAALRRVPVTKPIKQRGVLPDAYRDALYQRVLLGLGWQSGLGIEQRIGYPTLRGRLICFKKMARLHFRTRHGLLLTPHTYSAAGVGAPSDAQEDVVVPIFDTRLIESGRLPPHWITIHAPWGKQITRSSETVAFSAAPELVASVRRDDGITEVYEQSITAAEMTAIEVAVATYLGLAASDPPAIQQTTNLAVCLSQR